MNLENDIYFVVNKGNEREIKDNSILFPTIAFYSTMKRLWGFEKSYSRHLLSEIAWQQNGVKEYIWTRNRTSDLRVTSEYYQLSYPAISLLIHMTHILPGHNNINEALNKSIDHGSSWTPTVSSLFITMQWEWVDLVFLSVSISGYLLQKDTLFYSRYFKVHNDLEKVQITFIGLLSARIVLAELN